ncbi:DUF4181 domain-containing protein [Psychrobacillus sp.]|uniref:DUF4181 domain-containing protein n=1 Tax=Psychrobacillus sp. TaxID=1871623 RepID=UPI0028BDE47E|nr:DUF4181 domain-containing protein [Psychrobacillus sp.]
MFLLKLIVIFLVIFAISHLLGIILRRVLKTEKRKIRIHKPVNKTQKTVERVLLILFFIGLVIQTLDSVQIGGIPSLLITFIIVLNCYRAFMEWKYKKESKEHIITLSELVFFVIFMFLFFQLNIIDWLLA